MRIERDAIYPHADYGEVEVVEFERIVHAIDHEGEVRHDRWEVVFHPISGEVGNRSRGTQRREDPMAFTAAVERAAD